jgi:hypothetical protein
MFKELLYSLTNTVIEVNVINGEAYENFMKIYAMFAATEGMEVNEHEFYKNIYFAVKNKDAKCVKKILSKLDGVISYR